MSLVTMVDMAACGVVVLGIFLGFRRRLSGELAHLIGMAAAFGTGVLTYRPLGQWLLEHGGLGPSAARATALVGAMVAALLAMTAVRIALKRIMSLVIEEETDKMGGALAGGIRSALFVIVVFLLMNAVDHEGLNRMFGDDSLIGGQVVRFMPRLEDKIGEKLDAMEEGRKREE